MFPAPRRKLFALFATKVMMHLRWPASLVSESPDPRDPSPERAAEIDPNPDSQRQPLSRHHLHPPLLGSTPVAALASLRSARRIALTGRAHGGRHRSRGWW